LICDKLMLQEGESLLDIGCGWGTLARHAAKVFFFLRGGGAGGGWGSVCECVIVSSRVSVSVCVCVRERERESLCESVRVSE
jgi:hypothetical protein